MFFIYLLTMPGAPFVYYGDEIGMRYLPQTSKEGGYNRTGSRTPMQWDSKAKNLGFSGANKKLLYLDVDRAEDAPCVKQELAYPLSFTNTIKDVIALRHKYPDLQASAQLEILQMSDDGVLCYKRGEHIAVAFNPTNEQRKLLVPMGEVLYQTGAFMRTDDGTVLVPTSAIIFKLN